MPWLPQPAEWKDLTAEAQAGTRTRCLSCTGAALRLRRAEPALAGGDLTWLPSPEGVLCYRRADSITVLVNLSAQPAELPADAEVLISSSPLDHDVLPPDTAAWLRAGATSPGAA